MKKIYIALSVFIFVIGLLLTAIYAKYHQGQVAGIETSSQPVVRGIILPHHNLAESIISPSFESLKGNSYSHIVIFGPNHFEPNINSVVTATNISSFSFESNLMHIMLNIFPDILTSSEIVSKEHSITLHLPYLNNYFPKSSVIPLVISPFASKNDLYERIDYLTSIVPEDTLYIASVDFAHDVMQDTGLKNNEESINVISNFDYQSILSYKDDHMDSSLSIAMLLRAMQSQGTTKWETWHSSHASLLKDDPSSKGTSYVIGVFR